MRATPPEVVWTVVVPAGRAVAVARRSGAVGFAAGAVAHLKVLAVGGVRREAVRAGTAGVEAEHHVVALPDAPHRGPDLHDHPGPLMTGDSGQAEQTGLQLHALSAAISPHAARHGQRAAAPGIADDARALLADMRRLMAREAGWTERLLLEPAPSWAALAIKLALATRAHAWFTELYLAPPDDEENDDDAEAEADPYDPPLHTGAAFY